MQVRLYDPNKKLFYGDLVSNSGLTEEKILRVLSEDSLLRSKPEDNEWFQNLEQGIIVYNPKLFSCALIPLL